MFSVPQDNRIDSPVGRGPLLETMESCDWKAPSREHESSRTYKLDCIVYEELSMALLARLTKRPNRVSQHHPSSTPCS